MKILHIISGDLWGGAESLVYGLIRESLKYPNHQVHVLLFNHGILEQNLREHSISIKVIDENQTPLFLLLTQSVAYIRNLKPDVIHTHKHKENVIGSLASFLTNTPSIRTAHGDTESDIKLFDGIKYLYKWLNIFCGRYIQKIIVAVSYDLREKLKKQYPDAKITTIHNGILLNNGLDNQSKEEDKNRKIHIGMICRLVPVKRVDIFLNIAKILSSNQPDTFDFVIFGNGPEELALKSRCNDLGLKDDVKFMGFVHDMKNHYSGIDILVITSDHEGLPMNLLESISHGIPVIAHAVGDISNVLCNGHCGVIINNQNPHNYADAINKLAHDSETIEIYTKNAFNHVKDEYSLERTTKKYIELYSSLAIC